jgi:hypothetical protein
MRLVESLTTLIVMDQISKAKDNGTKTYDSMWQFFDYNNIHNKCNEEKNN